MTAVMLLPAAVGAAAGEPGWGFSGDVRFGYFHQERNPRVGPTTRDDEGRMRVRLALDGRLAAGWMARGRLAGSYGTDNAPKSAYLRWDAPTRSGARFGDTTLDTLYVQRSSADGDWRVTLGRFQGGVTLHGVPGKALDRNDSTNVGINWTDGVRVERRVATGWQAQLELQYHDRDGIGQATQAPLDFSRGGSRVGTYLALVATEPEGIWVQRMLALTWLPNALATFGADDPRRDDYMALDAKLAAAWRLGEEGMRLLVGGEVGYAPNRPDRSVLATGGAGAADGLAWQASVNLMDIAPGHNIGVVYARVGGGWLLSPDFRANDELSEVRYQWRLSPNWSIEARYRIREEIKTPTATRAREDTDFYIRLSGRF